MNTELNELAAKLISELSEIAKTNTLGHINYRIKYTLEHYPVIDLNNMFIRGGFETSLGEHGWAILHTYDIKHFPLITEEKRVEIANRIRTELDNTKKRKRPLEEELAEYDKNYKKIYGKIRLTFEKRDELVSRINRILEEKYPRNPDPDYVAAKLARTLGEDAWSELHGSFAVQFPSIDEDSKKEISDKLRAYLTKENIGYLLWDE